jgi:hypothetical protein
MMAADAAADANAAAAGVTNEERAALQRRVEHRARNWSFWKRCTTWTASCSAIVMVSALYGLGWQVALDMVGHLSGASITRKAIFGWLVVVLAAPGCMSCACALRLLLGPLRPPAGSRDRLDGGGDLDVNMEQVAAVLVNNAPHMQAIGGQVYLDLPEE